VPGVADEPEATWRSDVIDRLEQARTVAGMAQDRGVKRAGGWIAATDAALAEVRFG
jgi:hypothetical protein